MPVRRRRRWSPAEITTILTQYRRSGLAQRAFAQRHDLSLSTFSRWLRLARAPKGANFVRVTLPTIPAGADFELVFPDGRRLRVPARFDPAALRTLLEVLAAC
jgi:transposase-like protein